MIIKRGIIQSFNPGTYTASVLLLEATSAFLSGVPVANSIDGTSALAGAWCAVLFFDEQNPTDAVVIATFANGSSGLPTPAPGRLTFVNGYQQLNAQSINTGATLTIGLTGAGSIPSGALGVLCKAFFTSSSTGSFVTFAPHGASNQNAYVTIGNLLVANGYMNGNFLVAVDSNGKVDIVANGGNCMLSLFTYGYVM